MDRGELLCERADSVPQIAEQPRFRQVPPAQLGTADLPREPSAMVPAMIWQLNGWFSAAGNPLGMDRSC